MVITIRSACSSLIKKKGQARRLKAIIAGTKIAFSPFIIPTEMKYVIIEADVINEHPKIIDECLKDVKREKVNSLTQQQTTDQIILEKFPQYIKLLKKELNNVPYRDIEHQIET